MTDLAPVVDAARARLADAPREHLGMLVTPRRMLGIARAPRVEPRGSAWHLGVLLLGDDELYATGEVVRSREEAPRGYTAQSQRERAALAAAAFRGGFPEGTAVHLGWQRIDPDAVGRGVPSGPIAVLDGILSVRWSLAGGYQPLTDYLADRIDLLLNPPTGGA